MKTFELSIPKPCHEKWSSFTPSQQGAFCASCQKEVIDFTGWSEDRLKAYFLQGTGSCGRFRRDQLKSYTQEPAPILKTYWLRTTLISAIVLFSSRTAISQSKGKTSYPIETREIKNQEENKKTLPDTLHISGTVTDGEGGIPGVNIIRKGTAEQIITDTDGKYHFIIANPGDQDTLSFRFIGYRIEERLLSRYNSTMVINVQMEPDITGLGQVVVGGVSSVRKISPRRWWWKIKSVFR